MTRKPGRAGAAPSQKACGHLAGNETAASSLVSQRLHAHAAHHCDLVGVVRDVADVRAEGDARRRLDDVGPVPLVLQEVVGRLNERVGQVSRVEVPRVPRVQTQKDVPAAREVDEDVVSKLTGKAAQYFAGVIAAIN